MPSGSAAPRAAGARRAGARDHARDPDLHVARRDRRRRARAGDRAATSASRRSWSASSSASSTRARWSRASHGGVHRALRRDPRVAGLRAAVRGRRSRSVVCAATAGSALLLVARAARHRLGYGPITPASSHVLARTAPPVAHGADVLDQADRRARGRGARGRDPARRSRWRSAGTPRSSCVAAAGSSSWPSRRSRSRARARRRDRAAGTALLARAASSRRCAASCATRACSSSSLIGFVYAAVQVCLIELPGRLPDRDAALVAGRRRLRADCAPHSAASSAGSSGARSPTVRCRRPASWRMLGIVAAAARRAGHCADAGVAACAVLLTVAALFGATAIGWNGVQLAEVARHAPAGEAGADHRRDGLHHASAA